MASLSRALSVVAALAAAVGAVEPTQLREAISSDSSCASEEGGSGVQLLQHKASAAVASGASAGAPLVAALLQTLSSEEKAALAAPFNCSAKPQYCGAPLHCEEMPPLTLGEELGWIKTVAENGHANLKLWCLFPTAFSEGIVKECLKNQHPKEAAIITYEEQRKNGALDGDGSYCFLVGHCDNTEVTENTTLADAEAMCDRRYGHDAWAKDLGIKDVHILRWMFGGGVGLKTGFHDRAAAVTMAKIACAMGNFHCDVLYCRETYCKIPEFVAKYGKYATQDPPPGPLFNPFG